MQELRLWQKDWRDENESITNKVDEFWAKQMPESGENAEQVEGNENNLTENQQSPALEDTTGEEIIVATRNVPEGEEVPVTNVESTNDNTAEQPTANNMPSDGPVINDAPSNPQNDVA